MKVAVAALSLLVSSICDAKNESTTSQSSSANGIHEKRRMTTQAIIGGSEATAGEYPWFAKAVYTNNDWAGCGGALVSPQFVLTAAHCLDFINGFEIGAFCHTNGSPNGNCGQASEIIDATKSIPHPDYDWKSLDNDFALIKLERAAQATPVAMDSNELSGSYTTAKKLWTVGFGNTQTIGSYYPEKLKHVSVSYVPNDTCSSAYSAEEYGEGSITSNMMCAADLDEDSCQGDSGGPLYDKGNNLLVGVVSWGEGCAERDFPGVYSRISSQWSWIVDTICSEPGSAKPGFCDGLTSSPTSTPVPCTDSPLGWYDIDGSEFDCEYYAEGNNCENYGDDYEKDGKTANEACCACGGGKDPSDSSGEDLCQDNDEKFQYSATNKKNCKFFGKQNTEQRCDKNNGIGNGNCPVTCKTGCKCYDTEGAILLWNGMTKTCNWAANNTEKRCKSNAIRANCPIVCGLC